MTECEWIEAWRGECGASIPEGARFCPEHTGETCRSCGDVATGECEATSGLVCGEPLCDDCDCTWI